MQEQEEDENELHINKEVEEAHEGIKNVFCFAALADKQSGTIYTDATASKEINIISWHMIMTPMQFLPF